MSCLSLSNYLQQLIEDNKAQFLQEIRIAKLPQGSAVKGGDLGGGGSTLDEETPLEQIAFSFFEEPMSKIMECRQSSDYTHFLHAMPVMGDTEENKPGLIDMQHQLECMLDEIKTAIAARRDAALNKKK